MLYCKENSSAVKAFSEGTNIYIVMSIYGVGCQKSLKEKIDNL